MELPIFFIKKIINNQLFTNTPTIDINDIFNYDINKTELINFVNLNKTETDDFEYLIIDKDISNANLNEEEEKEKNAYVNDLLNEGIRVKKVIEYLITNVEISKVNILNYKPYDYSNTSNHIRSKIKTNHNFDIKTFIIKNKINKEKIQKQMSLMLNKSLNDMNEFKLMNYYLFIFIIDIYNIYNKCIYYSIELLKEHPYLYRKKEEYLLNINPNYFKIVNDEIEIMHHNLIKNAYKKDKDKTTTCIILKKTKSKKYELDFK